MTLAALRERTGMTGRQINTTAATSLCFFADGWDSYLLVYSLPYIAKEFQVSLGVVSLAVLFTYGARWAGGLIAGELAGRIGRKRSLLISLGMIGVFTMATGLSPALTVLFGMRVLFGLGMGAVYATGGPLLAESITSKVRGAATGIFSFSFYWATIAAAGTYGLLFSTIGWRGLFLVGGASLVLIPYIALTVPESPVWLVQREAGRQADVISMWRLITPPLLAITIALTALEFGTFFSSFSISSLAPSFLKLTRHFPVGEIALAGSILGFGSMVGAALGGFISDRVGRKPIFWVCFVAALGPAAVAVTTAQPAVIVGAFFVQGVLVGAVGAVVIPVENENYPTEVRAAGSGLVHNLGALGGSIGTVLGAFLQGTVGFSNAILLVAGLGTVLGLGGTAFIRETRGISLEEAGTRVSTTTSAPGPVPPSASQL